MRADAAAAAETVVYIYTHDTTRSVTRIMLVERELFYACGAAPRRKLFPLDSCNPLIYAIDI